ncbi:MAG: hypothetical protein J0M00_08630 [Burkholderiales bacterium]|nr:hypothetical protein [Burkholderiales bacterium]
MLLLLAGALDYWLELRAGTAENVPHLIALTALLMLGIWSMSAVAKKDGAAPQGGRP